MPLREVSEGIATLTASCRGHVDGVVKVRVVLAESSDGQRRSLPDSESAGARLGGGGRVHCLDETTALKMHPSIQSGTFMAALKWDAASVAELLDVQLAASTEHPACATKPSVVYVWMYTPSSFLRTTSPYANGRQRLFK